MKETKIFSIRKILNSIGQEHLLAFYEQLNQNEKTSLLSQIEQLDFSKIQYWVDNYVKKTVPAHVPAHFDPAPFYPACPTDSSTRKKYSQAEKLGETLLAAGKVAAFVVAGGQGTRLGFDGPKGNFPISPLKNKTLFRTFAESLLAAGRKYNTDFIWYIMTSPLNHQATIEIFKSNKYFGLKEKDVFIFTQCTLPNFSFDGKILLADKSTIAAGPDGHGGSLRALYKSKATADMKNRGIEYLSYWQIDNPLVKILDPLFIGLHALAQAQMSSKTLIKAHPTEKIGNFCLIDGRVNVIEYSDLPDEQAHRRRPDGSLIFELGSIAIHIISVAFVEQLNADGFALPLHRAVKKIPHIDSAGSTIEPSGPNGVKLETFVFDALPLAKNSVILEIHRSEEFAPVKNAAGADSPAVTCRMMVERAACWLEKAGIKVPQKPDGSCDCIIEIAPGFALDSRDILQNARRVPHIEPGDRIYLDYGIVEKIAQ